MAFSTRPARPSAVLLLASAAVLVGVVALQALGAYRFVPVLSGSMSGFVEAGDVSVLRPLDARDLQVGDVIAFHPPTAEAALTLHRVVEMIQRGDRPVVRTKGDANEMVDPWTARLEGPQLWRATGRIPALGHAALWLQHRSLRLLVLAAILAVLVVMGLRKIWLPQGGPAMGEDRTDAPPTVSRRRVGLASAAVVVLAVTLVGVAGLRPGSAALTGRTAGASTVGTGAVGPPTNLRAQQLCDGAAPTAVRLTWAPPGGSDVGGQEIWRRASSGADVLVARVGPTAASHDDVVGAPGTSSTWVVRATAEGWTSGFSNTAALTGECEPDPMPTDVPLPEPEPEPTPGPTSEPTPDPDEPCQDLPPTSQSPNACRGAGHGGS